MSIQKKIDCFLANVLPNLTEEEASFIESICKWDNEQRSAFMMAKKIFEENMDKKLKKEKKQIVSTINKVIKNDKKIDKKMDMKCPMGKKKK